MSNLQTFSTRIKAQLLLTAQANVSRAALLGLTVAEWRALGDVPGHEFHGNQWTSGSGETVYHGTTIDRLEGIQKLGLLPQKGDAEDGRVFVTSNLSMAKAYARVRGERLGKESVVVEMKLSKGSPVKSVFEDEIFGTKGTVVEHLGKIASTKIVKVHRGPFLKGASSFFALGGPGSGWTAENGHVPGAGARASDKEQKYDKHVLSTDERTKVAEAGLYLHGSSGDFSKFEIQPGRNTEIYLSNPKDDPRRTTQAEHIASGPFGGHLYAVKVDESKLKKFDPPNDPVAKAIFDSVVTGEKGYWVEYPDMPKVVEAAKAKGYNDFRVREPSVQGFSRAITDTKALSIVKMPHAPRNLMRSLATSSRDATPVHRAADSNYKAMMIAVSYGFMRGKKAYKSGGVDAAVKAIKSALLTSLPPVLIKTFVAGGNAGVGMLPRQSRAAMRALAPFDIRFDVSNPAAVKYAREHASKIADDISQTSKDRINAAIADALDGDGLDAAYDTILDAVGSESRADMIARTESLDAANQGTLASWAEAVDNGLLDKSATKVWLASSDCCDLCDELSDEEVGLDEDFSSGDDAPPAHPSCRCSVSLGTGSAE